MTAHSHSPAEKQQIDREEQPHAFTHDGSVPSEKPLSRDAESGQDGPGIGGEENERGERRTAIAPPHPARTPGAVRGEARVGPPRTGPAAVCPTSGRASGRGRAWTYE